MQTKSEIERLQEQLQARDRQLSELAGKCQQLERSNSKLRGDPQQDARFVHDSVQEMRDAVKSLQLKLAL
jgi:cell division protein FtsB